MTKEEITMDRKNIAGRATALALSLAAAAAALVGCSGSGSGSSKPQATPETRTFLLSCDSLRARAEFGDSVGTLTVAGEIFTMRHMPSGSGARYEQRDDPT